MVEMDVLQGVQKRILTKCGIRGMHELDKKTRIESRGRELASYIITLLVWVSLVLWTWVLPIEVIWKVVLTVLLLVVAVIVHALFLSLFGKVYIGRRYGPSVVAFSTYTYAMSLAKEYVGTFDLPEQLSGDWVAVVGESYLKFELVVGDVTFTLDFGPDTPLFSVPVGVLNKDQCSNTNPGDLFELVQGAMRERLAGDADDLVNAGRFWGLSLSFVDDEEGETDDSTPSN